MTSKPGRYGTLFLFHVTYTCCADPDGFGRQRTSVWAYDSEDAEYRFDGDEEGWLILSVTRAR